MMTDPHRFGASLDTLYAPSFLAGQINGVNDRLAPALMHRPDPAAIAHLRCQWRVCCTSTKRPAARRLTLRAARLVRTC